MSEPYLDEFCQISNLESIENKPDCFKGPKSPLYINLVLTNKKKVLKSQNS